MNAKISVLVSCNEAMLYLLLYDLRDSTFKDIRTISSELCFYY